MSDDLGARGAAAAGMLGGDEETFRMLDQEVRPESFLKHHPFVFETDGRLSLDVKSPLVEHPGQHGLVHRFQQARAQVPVDAE